MWQPNVEAFIRAAEAFNSRDFDAVQGSTETEASISELVTHFASPFDIERTNTRETPLPGFEPGFPD